jgi:hypothetical protein
LNRPAPLHPRRLVLAPVGAGTTEVRKLIIGRELLGIDAVRGD